MDSTYKIISNILEEPKTMALLIKDYFSKECNIELGEFIVCTHESKETSALDYDRYICIDKYSFNRKTAQTYVYIKYIKDKDGNIDKDNVIINHIEIYKLSKSGIDTNKLFDPYNCLEDINYSNLEFISYKVLYLVKNVRLKIDLDMKFEKVED